MTTYPFSQIADNIRVPIMPSDTELDRYVGLEHLDPESLKIRRWGSPDDVIGQKLRFWVGDIVYGRRRAYQRKLAVADFDGICSAHALVLRAKPDVCLPEFLPFFLQSDLFHQRAMEISVGSLSPTINWGTLAVQEFPLPPVDEQRRIADLLWAADDAITEHQNALEKLQMATTSFLETQIADGVKTDWQKVLFDELLIETQYGISNKSGLQREGTVPILGIPNVVAGDTDFSKLSWVEVTDSEFKKYKLKPDDILIVRTNGNPNYVGRCVALKNIPQNAVYASYLIRLRVHENRAMPSFVESVLNSSYMRKTLMQVIRSSAGNYNLNTQGIRNQRIPLPSLDVQKNVMQTLDEFNLAKRALELHIENSKKLKSGLLNKYLLG